MAEISGKNNPAFSNRRGTGKPEKAECMSAPLLDAVTGDTTRINNTPEHNYLIGLAYLEGIDLEVNAQAGIQLIESAADAGERAAVKKLVTIYSLGRGAEKNMLRAIAYQKSLPKVCRKKGMTLSLICWHIWKRNCVWQNWRLEPTS